MQQRVQHHRQQHPPGFFFLVRRFHQPDEPGNGFFGFVHARQPELDARKLLFVVFIFVDSGRKLVLADFAQPEQPVGIRTGFLEQLHSGQLVLESPRQQMTDRISRGAATMRIRALTVAAVSALALSLPAFAQKADKGELQKGKAVFDKTCAGCHKNMSPKITEKDKWASILKQGEPAMVAAVMKGKGVMPPKGGAANEADVRAAVKYLETVVK